MGATPETSAARRSSEPSAAAIQTRRSLKRAFVFVIVVTLVNVAGAHALDALGLTESLLSSSLPRAVIAAALGLAFFTARLLAFFVAPGLLIAALVVYAAARAR